MSRLARVPVPDPGGFRTSPQNSGSTYLQGLQTHPENHRYVEVLQ